MRLGDWTYPPRACGCSPELFLYLLSNFLHCNLGLFDGSLCRVKPAEVRKSILHMDNKINLIVEL